MRSDFCQSGTLSAGQENIRGASTKLLREIMTMNPTYTKIKFTEIRKIL